MSALAEMHPPAAEATPALRGRRLVVAGAATPGAIGLAVAERALRAGAHVTLTAAPGDLERCRELADRLPRGAHVVCADLDREEDVGALREHLRCAYGTVDGALHAVPSPAALGALSRAVVPLFPPAGGSLVGLAPHGDGASEWAPADPGPVADALLFLLSERGRRFTAQARIPSTSPPPPHVPEQRGAAR